MYAVSSSSRLLTPLPSSSQIAAKHLNIVSFPSRNFYEASIPVHRLEIRSCSSLSLLLLTLHSDVFRPRFLDSLQTLRISSPTATKSVSFDKRRRQRSRKQETTETLRSLGSSPMSTRLQPTSTRSPPSTAAPSSSRQPSLLRTLSSPSSNWIPHRRPRREKGKRGRERRSRLGWCRSCLRPETCFGTSSRIRV